MATAGPNPVCLEHVERCWTACHPPDPPSNRAKTDELREAYRRHTKGNSLYRNHGDGTFEETGDAQHVEMGPWAWSADGHDFDNDGSPEIFVTCGMLTGSKAPPI